MANGVRCSEKCGAEFGFQATVLRWEKYIDKVCKMEEHGLSVFEKEEGMFEELELALLVEQFSTQGRQGS